MNAELAYAAGGVREFKLIRLVVVDAACGHSFHVHAFLYAAPPFTFHVLRDTRFL